MQDWRVLELAGVHNFRDYGGYGVSGGGRLRRAVLWRSGQHHDATQADLDRIAQLELAAIIDLRYDVERVGYPCRRPAGYAGKVLFGSETAPRSARAAAAPHIEAAQVAKGHDAAAMRVMMARNYALIPFRRMMLAAMRLYLAELAQTGSPGHARATLVHCLAGKDRTGIAVAMFHHAVGVHPDDIMADYLATNTAGDGEARIAAGGRVVEALSGPIDPEPLRVLMSVEPEYLHIAFTAMAQRHGSVDGFLEDALGVDAAMRENLRVRLVE